jgi:hypothetical protein
MTVILSANGLNMNTIFEVFNFDVVEIEKYMPSFYISMPKNIKN